MNAQARVALVTGGNRGIGAAIVRALADSGCRVAFTYAQRESEAAALAAELARKGAPTRCFRLDLERRSSIRQVVESVRREFGSLDILINNAAIAQEKPFETLSDEDWDQMLAVNLRGPFACCQEVLPDMLRQGWGRIINLTSIGGQWGGMNQVHYACAKSGLIGLTRSLAKVYSPRGITTNAIAPGLVLTEMSAPELETEGGRAKLAGIPARRLGTVDEVAAAVVFLVSEAAGYITGQTLNLNGGMYFT